MDNAYIAITLSVLMHVCWNLLARHVDARCNFLWWGLLVHLILLGPWAFWRLIVDSHWNSTLLIAMAVTAAANTVYFLALRKAYHSAPVALVYPIVRSSPLLIAFRAWLLFNQSISLGGVLGISISAVGLWILATKSNHGNTAHALPWAMLAAVATSIYSLSDKAAVESLPSFGAQLGFITVGYAASFIGLTFLQYRTIETVRPVCRPKLAFILPGGLFIGVVYALVVRAMLQLPAAYVVAYTNAGIVLATVLSIWLFKERVYWQSRLLAAVITTVGLIVLGLNV